MNNSFYPRLFINEVASPKIVVGRDKEAVLYDKVKPNRILRVGDKESTDLITWDELKSVIKKSVISNYGKDLKSFLIDKGYDVDAILKNTKEPEPDITYTYGEFWDEQVLKHKENLRKFAEEKGSNEDRDFDISIELFDFFEQNGKQEEFQIFIDSIPGGEVKIPLNNLFSLMTSVVNEKPFNGKFMGQPLSLNKSNFKQWQNDMLEYLHFLTDINQLVNSSLYQNEILQDGTFLNALFIIKAAGLGRGEILLLYLTKDSKVSGGSESFDLRIGDIKYEVKEYVMSSDCSTPGKCSKKAEIGPIRLGTGGKVTRFQFWRNIQETIRIAQEVYEKYKDSLQSITGDYLYEVWLNLIDDNLENPAAVLAGVAGGEVGKERWNMLRLWYYLANEFTTKGVPQSKDEYTMATLKGPDVKPDTVLIEPIEKDELKVGDKIEIKSDEDITEMITVLKNLPYVKDPESLEDDIKKMPVDYFEREGLDKFIVFRRKKIYIADGTQFSFAKISQAGVSIIESDLLKDESDVGKRGYEAWKQKIQEEIKDAETKEEKSSLTDIARKFNLYDFVIQELEKDFEETQQLKIEQKKKSYLKQSARDKQKRLEKKSKLTMKNESFYPRLFNSKLNERIDEPTVIAGEDKYVQQIQSLVDEYEKTPITLYTIYQNESPRVIMDSRIKVKIISNREYKYTRSIYSPKDKGYNDEYVNPYDLGFYIHVYPRSEDYGEYVSIKLYKNIKAQDTIWFNDPRIFIDDIGASALIRTVKKLSNYLDLDDNVVEHITKKLHEKTYKP